MNQSVFLLYSIAFLLITGCDVSDEKAQTVNKKNDYINCGQKTSDISKIKMSENETIPLEGLVEKNYTVSVSILNITEARLFIGTVSKLWMYKDNYYLADMEISKKLYAFDKNGKLVFVLENNGEGPGQHKMLWDIQFNYSQKRLEIWDLSLHKLLFFDLEGKFISEQKVNLPIMSFFPVTQDWYVYHLDGRDNMGKQTPLLQLLDITKKQIINQGVYEYGIVDASFTKQEFSYYQGSPYFLRPMMDTIYWIGPVHGHICPTYIIDFEGKSIPIEAKQETDLMKAGNLIQRAGSSFVSGELVVGRTFMSFEWLSSANNQRYISFVDRFQDKAYQVKEKDLQLFGIYLEKMLAIDETAHNFISYAFPHKVDKEKLAMAIVDKDLPEATRKELTKIQQLTDQEMPFLVTFRLKHPESDGKP
jgi:hypothetical protein